MTTPRSQQEMQLLGEMRIVFGAARKHISAVKRETGISAALLWALDEVVRNPGLSPGELANRLNVHSTTASNLCSKLKSARLILARAHGKDRRVMLLTATSAGRKLTARAPEPKTGVLPAAIKALEDAELTAAIAALRSLRARVTQLGYADDPMQPLTKRQ